MMEEEKKVVYPTARGRMGPYVYREKARRVPRSIKRATRWAEFEAKGIVPLSLRLQRKVRRK